MQDKGHYLLINWPLLVFDPALPTGFNLSACISKTFPCICLLVASHLVIKIFVSVFVLYSDWNWPCVMNMQINIFKLCTMWKLLQLMTIPIFRMWNVNSLIFDYLKGSTRRRLVGIHMQISLFTKWQAKL